MPSTSLKSVSLGRLTIGVIAHAVGDGRVLLSADTGFAEILARTHGAAPSVILFHRTDRSPAALPCAQTPERDHLPHGA